MQSLHAVSVVQNLQYDSSWLGQQRFCVPGRRGLAVQCLGWGTVRQSFAAVQRCGCGTGADQVQRLLGLAINVQAAVQDVAMHGAGVAPSAC